MKTCTTCTTCKKAKPFSEFYKNSSRKDGYVPVCKECHRAYRKRHYRKNREEIKEYQRDYRRRWRIEKPEQYASQCKKWVRKNPMNNLKKYGLTIVEWDEMMLNQGGLCAICNKESKLGVDHSHITRKVRALLCHACNVAIGFLKDSPELAMNAATYLKKYEQA